MNYLKKHSRFQVRTLGTVLGGLFLPTNVGSGEDVGSDSYLETKKLKDINICGIMITCSP
jgi:hypothetical protein